jgi:hypothetical protein
MDCRRGKLLCGELKHLAFVVRPVANTDHLPHLLSNTTIFKNIFFVLPKE